MQSLILDELKYNFALLTLLANPKDMVALRFLLGFGNPTYRAGSYKYLYDYAVENNMTTIDVLEKCASGTLCVPHISSLISQYKSIREKIKTLQSAAEDNAETLIDLLAADIPENGDFRYILTEAVAAAENSREENVSAWLHEIYSYSVEKVSYPDNTSEHDHVRIMSLHASKGLSAKYVIVMSAIDELI